MLIKHLENMIKRMNHDGEWYAQQACYRDKTASHEQAFIAGFVDACILVKRYCKQYHIDKASEKCYTPRKAHKK